MFSDFFPYFFGRGYAGAGGAIGSQTLSGFNSWSGDATGDYAPVRYIVASRCRQLYISNPFAASIIDRFTAGIVGTGIDFDIKKSNVLNPADIAAFKRKFGLFSHARMLDAQRKLTFHQMQVFACRNWLLSGEVFFVKTTKGWRCIEADRCMSPYSECLLNGVCKNQKTNNTIIDGVEVDDAGAVVAYWFSDHYLTSWESILNNNNIRRVEAFDRFGNANVIHLYNPIRPDQYRGVSILANSIENLVMMQDYMQATLLAAQCQAASYGFITSNSYDDMQPASLERLDEKIPVERVTENTPADAPRFEYDPTHPWGENNFFETFYPRPTRIKPGTFHHLREGEDIKYLQPTHPNSNFNNFISEMKSAIAASVGLPKQVLDCTYDTTYASARAGVLESNKTYKNLRSFFIDYFCRPIVEYFAFEHAKIDDPDQKYLLAKEISYETSWTAPVALSLDPTKEIDAWAKSIELGLATADEASVALYGHKASGTVEKTDEKTVYTY